MSVLRKIIKEFVAPFRNGAAGRERPDGPRSAAGQALEDVVDAVGGLDVLGGDLDSG